MLSRLQVMDMMLAYSAVALTFTVFRLAIRKARNWGKDDALVVLATAALLAQSIMMNLKNRNVSWANNGPDQAATIYYLNNTFFYLQDWAARLSLLFSILRICPHPGLAKFLKIMAVVFILTWVTLVSLLIGYCKKTENVWSVRKPLAVCQLHKSIIYLQFAVGILSDLVLVGVPIKIFTMMPTLKRLALRLQILFCSTFLLTAATVVQTAITLSAAGRAGTAGLIAATTETFVAIMVCNATSIVLALVILFGPGEDQVPLREGTVLGKGGDAESGDANSTHTGSEKGGVSSSTGGGAEQQTMSLRDRWTRMDIDENY